ncbi:MAG TPA: hypothetical protein VG146_13270 [Verrucomicrobiae bacterium]|nr:hypothetical protein [Verrucomicrobiae bacterium]
MNPLSAWRYHAAHRLVLALLASGLGLLGCYRALGEIIFEDLFTQPAGSVTNSIPWIDVQGDGWQASSPALGLSIDGQGHLFNPVTNLGGSAGVPLIPIGPHGSMTIYATVSLPPASSEWVGFGFGNSNQFLAGNGSQSGPWLKVQGNGSLTLYSGSGENGGVLVPSAYANTGAPVQFALAYDAFLASATVKVAASGVTNTVFDNMPITNSLGAVLAHYLIFQFPSNAAPPSARSVGPVSVDWHPRPGPLLALPTPPAANVVSVGAPTGGSDIQLIQGALNAAASLSGGAEVRFQSGATYIITNNSTTAGVPLSLSHATAVLVNGNGCKVLIANPRIGFLDLFMCTNIIVQGFSVDYDPLPFTQGVVTTNLSGTEKAFEFRVDPGYPAPTNSNYLDQPQWGTFMDPTRPGRLADNHSTIYDFSAVQATPTSGIFKVVLKNASKLATIQPGDIWCQLGRWDGSTLFRARNCYQVTFLDLTNYTGAAAAFAGSNSYLVNEIDCQIIIGPSPGGPQGVPRVKTTNADGGLFGNPRIGPWVEGCNFIGLSDDVANANTLPFFVAGPVPNSTNTFHLIGYTPGGALADVTSQQLQAGDDVMFYNGTNGTVFNRASITSVEPPYVTFDHNISGIFAGLDTTNTLLFDNSLNSSAVYLNNTFSNSRIHGIYCRANNMLIARNVITGMGVSAIAAHPALSLSGPNSFVPTNVVIMDNVLADGGCSYEAIHNTDPNQEPTWALIQLHKAIAASDYIPQGQEISGIRILYNAFLQWRRGAITLHNVTDANIIGNYFGPPLTNYGLTALTNHVVADLWACDYPGVRIRNNVKPGLLPDAQAIREDGQFATLPGAFQPLSSPFLAMTQAAGTLAISWNSPAPAFVLQQAQALDGPTNWMDIAELPYLAGASNTVELPLPAGLPAGFFRARQR